MRIIIDSCQDYAKKKARVCPACGWRYAFRVHGVVILNSGLVCRNIDLLDSMTIKENRAIPFKNARFLTIAAITADSLRRCRTNPDQREYAK